MIRVQTRRKNSIVGFFVLIIVGVVFLIIGLSMYRHQQKFAKNGIATEATVINMVSQRSTDSVTYKPEVEFQTENGETIQVIHTTGSNPPRYKKGEVINIYYMPDNPYEITIDSAFERVIFPFIFIVLGGLCCLMALGAVVGVIKRLLIRGIAS